MSSFSRFGHGATRPRGMWLLLSLLTLLFHTPVTFTSPAIIENEKPQQNSTIVVLSSTTENAAPNTDETVTSSVSENPSVAVSPSRSTTSRSTTVINRSSTTQNLSSTTNLPKESVKPSNSSPTEDTFTSYPTTIAYNSSVDELSYTEVNVTNVNASHDEEFLKSSAADSVFNVTIIAGISSLVILIIVLIGVLSFVLYRHFSWNRPQTLSDKFSNDESTGYIDDSAFRENSEEMYSLDNDSFLNSLEAMTIQNYWTDHVKHTKL